MKIDAPEIYYDATGRHEIDINGVVKPAQKGLMSYASVAGEERANG